MPDNILSFHPKQDFTLQDVKDLLSGRKTLQITAATRAMLEESLQFLREFSADKLIYGINTGFGPMAQYRIEDKSLIQLQYNIIRSHATGAGTPLDEQYVQAAILARLSTFLQGYSAVSTELIDLLLIFLEKRISPLIPEHGGVGASGDLVQLAHMGLALIGEGELLYEGRWRESKELFEELKLAPLTMKLREGLSLCNGTSVMTGIGLINQIKAMQLLKWALIASSMMNEIAASYDDFASPILHASKKHLGQARIASAMRAWMQGNNTLKKREKELYRKQTERQFEQKVQPYYSLRCVPQILGPIYECLVQSEKVLIDELNSASDNPIIDVESANVYHGGNFHGDYVAFEMDKMRIAITKLSMLAERQLNYLMHDRINGILPPFLSRGQLGLNYGMQASQFTATSTTAENQTLASPIYTHSIPCNNDNQDIVSMGCNAALLTKRVIDNAYQVMAVHLMAIAEAIDCLEIEDKLAPSSLAIYKRLRSIQPSRVADLPRYKEIESIKAWLENEELDLEL